MVSVFRRLNKLNFTLRSRTPHKDDKAKRRYPHSPQIDDRSRVLADRNLKKYLPAIAKRYGSVNDDIDLLDHMVPDERQYIAWKPTIIQSCENLLDTQEAEFNVTPRIEALLEKYRQAQTELSKKRYDSHQKLPPEYTFRPKLIAKATSCNTTPVVCAPNSE